MGLCLVLKRGFWSSGQVTIAGMHRSFYSPRYVYITLKQYRYEGSKDWETMLGQGRNLSRQIWITVSVPEPKVTNSTATVKPTPSRASSINHRALREDKVRVLNLIIGYFYAVKHHLRHETGLHHPDMAGLFPEDFSRFDHETSNHFTAPIRDGAAGDINPPPIAPRIKGVGTASTYPDQRTPLLNDEYHTVHFHTFPDVNSQSLPLM